MSIADFFADNKEEKKEKKMAARKATVAYSLTDGIAPEGDVVMKLKVPMALDLRADQNLTVKLGLTFDVPILLLQTEGLSRQGVKLLNSGDLHEAGREVVLHLSPEGMAMFERGDVVAAALPLTTKFKLEKE